MGGKESKGGGESSREQRSHPLSSQEIIRAREVLARYIRRGISAQKEFEIRWSDGVRTHFLQYTADEIIQANTSPMLPEAELFVVQRNNQENLLADLYVGPAKGRRGMQGGLVNASGAEPNSKEAVSKALEYIHSYLPVTKTKG